MHCLKLRRTSTLCFDLLFVFISPTPVLTLSLVFLLVAPFMCGNVGVKMIYLPKIVSVFFFLSVCFYFIVRFQALAKLNDRHPITSDLLLTVYFFFYHARISQLLRAARILSFFCTLCNSALSPHLDFTLVCSHLLFIFNYNVTHCVELCHW